VTGFVPKALRGFFPPCLSSCSFFGKRDSGSKAQRRTHIQEIETPAKPRKPPLQGLSERHNPRLHNADVRSSSHNSLLQGWKTQKSWKHKILDSLKG